MVSFTATPEHAKNHENKHISVPCEYQGKKVQIDLGMVFLIEYLWNDGIQTSGCCQGTYPADNAYIRFDRMQDAHSFYLWLKHHNFPLDSITLSTRNKYRRRWDVQFLSHPDWQLVPARGILIINFSPELLPIMCGIITHLTQILRGKD